LSPEAKLARAQQTLDKWIRVAANPKLPPKAAAWARDAVTSLQAELDLHLKALAYQRERNSGAQ
jgi:hypothetical protein